MKEPGKTKIDCVRAMLGQPGGVTLAEICEVTGWQAHSARAALSGLRKAGVFIERLPSDEDKAETSRYRIVAAREVVE